MIYPVVHNMRLDEELNTRALLTSAGSLVGVGRSRALSKDRSMAEN
jgi:hypothetical protein